MKKNPYAIMHIKCEMRCGSRAVCRFFSNAGYIHEHTHRKWSNQFITRAIPYSYDKFVIHDHKPNVIFNNKYIKNNYFILHILRRNRFDQILSNIITSLISQYDKLKGILKKEDTAFSQNNNYKNIFPQLFIPFELIQTTKLSLDQDESIRYKTIKDSNVPFETVYFEDFIDNMFYFNKFLDIPANKIEIVGVTTIKAKDFVLNYEALKMQYFEIYS